MIVSSLDDRGGPVSIAMSHGVKSAFMVVPHLRPAGSSSQKGEVKSHLEGVGCYEIAYLCRSAITEDRVSWFRLTAESGHLYHTETGRMRLLEESIDSVGSLECPAMTDLQLRLERDGEMLVAAKNYDDSCESSGLPASALILNTSFIYMICERWPETRAQMKRFGSFGSFWLAIEGVNQVRFMRQCRPVSYLNSEGFNVTVLPLRVVEVCCPDAMTVELMFEETVPSWLRDSHIH